VHWKPCEQTARKRGLVKVCLPEESTTLYAVAQNERTHTLNIRILPKFVFALMLAFLLPGIASSQELKSLETTAKGQGTIESRVDKHKINAVLVILRENGDANIILYADLQLSATGRWSLGKSLSEGINLEITGGIVSGNAAGAGKLFLRNDGKSIDRLTISAQSTGGANIKVEFVADKAENSQ